MGHAHAWLWWKRRLGKMAADKFQGNQKDLSNEVSRIEGMINSHQAREFRNKTRGEYGYIRPKNASTMILIDGSRNKPRILMGKRNKKLKFMPGALVFPGGSVDKFDGSVAVGDELTNTTENRLMKAMRGKPTQRGARALGVAAVREVAEESGLLLGKSGILKNDHEDWADFKKQNLVPSLSALRLFARAITPPGNSRRFDTWFFIAHASEIGFTPEGGFDADGELEDLQWIRPKDAITENTREITRVMLVELIQRLEKDPNLSDDYPAPHYQTVGNRFRKTII